MLLFFFSSFFEFEGVVFEVAIEAKKMQCHSEPVDNPEVTIVHILAR